VLLLPQSPPSCPCTSRLHHLLIICQAGFLPVQAGKEGEIVVGLLKQLAPLYNKLYDTAKQVGG
jgi:hypothetical protein